MELIPKPNILLYRYAKKAEYVEAQGNEMKYILSEMFDYARKYINAMNKEKYSTARQNTFNTTTSSMTNQNSSIKISPLFEKNLMELEPLITNLENTLSDLNISPEHIEIQLKKIVYNIESSNGRNIDLHEYLNHSKGVGGQIAGFLDFLQESNGSVWFTNKRYLWDTNRSFIIFLQKDQGKFINNIIVENLQKENSITIEEVEVELSTIVIPKKRTLQYFQAGMLMGEHSNISEVNIVADCSLFGFELNVNILNLPTIDFRKQKLEIKLEKLELEQKRLKDLELKNKLNNIKLLIPLNTKGIAKDIVQAKRDIKSLEKPKNIMVETISMNNTIEKYKSKIFYVILSILKYTDYPFKS